MPMPQERRYSYADMLEGCEINLSTVFPSGK